jgi:hypothetical protein
MQDERAVALPEPVGVDLGRGNRLWCCQICGFFCIPPYGAVFHFECIFVCHSLKSDPDRRGRLAVQGLGRDRLPQSGLQVQHEVMARRNRRGPPLRMLRAGLDHVNVDGLQDRARRCNCHGYPTTPAVPSRVTKGLAALTLLFGRHDETASSIEPPGECTLPAANRGDTQ